MRIALKFKVKDRLVLPKSYQHKVQGFIYSLIEDDEFRAFLHNEGFGDARSFKLFTFSLLKGPYTYDADTHTVVFDDYFYLEIASVVEPFIENIIAALLKHDNHALAGHPIELETYRYIGKTIRQKSLTIEMMSPITVYETDPETKKTTYYEPEDPRFEQAVRDNFARKFTSVYETDKPLRIHLRPISVTKKDKLVIRFKDHVIIAYKGIYRLEGDPQFLDFLYRTGLGAKNSMGFGMFRVKQ